MDTATLWFLVVGLVFVGMALTTTLLKRLPLTSSIFYLVIGVAIGPFGLGLLDLDLVGDARILARLTEVVVIIALFTAGLKLRLDWRDRRWGLPVRLAVLSMAVTVGLIALAGWLLLGLPIGAAVLLGAVLAPTDPVLASEVQVADPDDRDRLRFGLTGEAGLNEGTAFPFVMLGFGLLSLHDLGPFGWRWLAVDVVWAVAAGLAAGAILGTAIGYLVVHLRRTYQAALGLDDFLTLGLIALSYGAAVAIHGYGFLAVFAAGLALRRIEQRQAGAPFEETRVRLERGDDEAAIRPETASAFMAKSVLGFNEQLERIAVVVLVVLVGSVLSFEMIPIEASWFVPVTLLVIRPVAVWAGTIGAPILPVQRRMIAWFGIRGIGSIHYLMYAILHGVEDDLAWELAGLTLTTVAVSVVVHGISVTPLMSWYAGRFGAKDAARPASRETG